MATSTIPNHIKVTSPSGDNATFETGGYFTIGKIVIVDITLKVSSSGATVGTKLIKELPASTQNDKPLFGMMMGSVNNNLVSFRMYGDVLYPNSNIGAGRYHVYGCYTTY